MASKWHLISTQNHSTCTCGSSDGDYISPYPRMSEPIFVICWACRAVAEIGVGGIERETEPQYREKRQLQNKDCD